MTTRAAIITEARAWLGTPFGHQGRVKGLRTDCIGLIAGTAIACGLYGPDLWALPEMQPYLGYGHLPDGQRLRQAMDRFMVRIPVPEAGPADVLLMRFDAAPQHVAMLTGPDTLIHAYAQARRVTEHGLDDIWRRRICGAYRFPGIEPWQP